jgi:hypothetical protein
LKNLKVIEGGISLAILGESGLSGYVKKFLDLIFWGGLCVYVTLPFCLKWYFNYANRYGSENFYFLLVLLYITGFFCLWIVLEIRKIFKTLNRMDPFIMGNVRSLNRMGYSAFIIAAAYFVKIFLYNSFLTIIVAMVFLIAGLFCVILAEVFRQAVIYKEENDLTI